MNELMEFLGGVNTPVAVATMDGDQPRVRMFSFKMVVDGKIYFITSEKKSVYKQLVANNKVEICSMPSKDNEWVRLDAKFAFVKDVELNKKAFELLPMLSMAYTSPENSEIVLLEMQDIDAKKYSLAGKAEKISL